MKELNWLFIEMGLFIGLIVSGIVVSSYWLASVFFTESFLLAWIVLFFVIGFGMAVVFSLLLSYLLAQTFFSQVNE